MATLGDVLSKLTGNHALDPIMDAPRVNSQDCKLKSGEESLFVTFFCHELQQRLVGAGVVKPFHHLFYCPSRKTEWRLGFDLSIGRNKTEGVASPRYRTMHKLVTGRCCDGRWTCSLKDDDALHMAVLMAAQQGICDRLWPYLVIHVCLCVHDYRRMGCEADKEQVIPSFRSPLRTIIVDLRKVREKWIHQLSQDQWREFVEAIRKCEDKSAALELAEELGVERLKVVNNNPTGKLYPESKDALQYLFDKHHPVIRYPATAQPDTSAEFFLTFDQFADSVVKTAQEEWV